MSAARSTALHLRRLGTPISTRAHPIPRAGARPVELPAMIADGIINADAVAGLPKPTGPPVFLNPAQATAAASYLAANRAREVS